MMQFETFKTIAVFATHLFTFCIGLENGVIIPSILEYLTSLGAQYEAILGIAIAGYGLTNCLSSHFLRRLVEASYSVRNLLVLCSVSYITGGLFYCYGKTWWGVILARLFCGFGSGALAVITADISRNALDIEHTEVYSRLHLSLALGWVLSPLFSLPIFSFQTLGMEEYCFPGYLCVAIFILCGVFSAARLCDLGRILRFSRLRQSLSLAYERTSVSSRKSYGAVADLSSSSSSDEGCHAKIYGLCSNQFSAPSLVVKRHSFDIKQQRLESGTADYLTKSDEILETAESYMGEPITPLKNEISEINGAISSAISTPGEQISEPMFQKLGIFSRQGACACYNFGKTYWLGSEFLAAFFYGCIQTMLTPLTSQFFMFGNMENALIQLVLGGVGVAPVWIMSSNTKSLPLGGCLLATISLCWLIAPAIQVGNVGSLPAFSIGMVGLSLACGLLFSSCSPLDPEVRSQTTWAWGVGLVLGPLWAASTAPQPCLLLGAQLILVLLATMKCLLT